MSLPGTTEAASRTCSLPDSSLLLLRTFACTVFFAIATQMVSGTIMIFNCDTLLCRYDDFFLSDCVILFHFSMWDSFSVKTESDAFKTLSNTMHSFHTFSKTDG